MATCFISYRFLIVSSLFIFILDFLWAALFVCFAGCHRVNSIPYRRVMLDRRQQFSGDINPGPLFRPTRTEQEGDVIELCQVSDIRAGGIPKVGNIFFHQFSPFRPHSTHFGHGNSRLFMIQIIPGTP